jgi:hypothetical protein
VNEIDTLRATVKGLSLAVPRWIEDMAGEDPVALVLLLDDLRALRQELAGVEAYAEAQAARAMPGRRMVLPDGRVAERNSSSKRTDWEQSRILTALLNRAVAGAAGDLDEAGRMLVAEVVKHAGIGYWRKSVGLDLDLYSVREPGRRTVRITDKPAGGEPDAA